tara:strand:+ start:214 stop:516 length:303 start_codon:yes stop_codon:yes gene_type:complete
MITIVVITKVPKIFTNVFLLHKKNGKEIIIQIAKSFVFQRNPVGGLMFEYKKILSNSEKLTGSFPKKVAIDEYEEIGILKVVNDSIRAIAISTKIKIERI